MDVVAEKQGIINGSVSIAGAVEDQYATIDFRQRLTCIDAVKSADITVRSVNVANNSDYSVSLPAGDYEVVASSSGNETMVYNSTVSSNTAILGKNITLPSLP